MSASPVMFTAVPMIDVPLLSACVTVRGAVLYEVVSAGEVDALKLVLNADTRNRRDVSEVEVAEACLAGLHLRRGRCPGSTRSRRPCRRRRLSGELHVRDRPAVLLRNANARVPLPKPSESSGAVATTDTAPVSSPRRPPALRSREVPASVERECRDRRRRGSRGRLCGSSTVPAATLDVDEVLQPARRAARPLCCEGRTPSSRSWCGCSFLSECRNCGSPQRSSSGNGSGALGASRSTTAGVRNEGHVPVTALGGSLPIGSSSSTRCRLRERRSAPSFRWGASSLRQIATRRVTDRRSPAARCRHQRERARGRG